jgi:exopolysaccharide production protein ExoQ
MTFHSAELERSPGRDAATNDRVQSIAWIILSVLPLGMAIASRSAPAFLVAAALVSLGGRVAEGEGRDVLRRLGTFCRTPLGWTCLAFAAIALLSLTWGHHFRVASFVIGEVALSAGAALVLAAALPRAVPPAILRLAAAAFGLACVLILADLAMGLPLRRALGVRAVTYIYNRPSITLLLVFWPLAGLLWAAGYRIAVCGLALLLIATVLYCDSGAAVLGLVAGALAFGLALALRRSAVALVGLGMLGALAVAPVMGAVADWVAPPAVVEGLQDAHARDRIEIWQSFGAAVRERFVLGTGFGTSSALAGDPVAREVPEEARVLLGVWHAHNGYLQVWIELGLVGALVAGLAIVLLLRGVSRLDGVRPQRAAALAAIGSAAAIMLVGHSAWQGWWLATLGATSLWVSRSLQR